MADYDIGGAGGYKNLYNGGIYSWGEWERLEAYDYKWGFNSLPQAINVMKGGNLLSADSIQGFIDANAFTGYFQNQQYSATDWLHIIRIDYGGGRYVDMCMRAACHFEGWDRITQLICSFITSDGRHVGSMYGGNPIQNVHLLEDPRYNYLFAYEFEYNNQRYITFHYGAYDDAPTTAEWLTYDELCSRSVRGEVKDLRGYLEMTTSYKQTFNGQEYEPVQEEHGEHSSEGGGEGDYNTSSDTVDFPTLPVLSAVGSGILTLWNPSVSELRAFSDYLWSNDVFDTIKKFISSPMELIVSLSIVPVAPPIADTSTNIHIGGIDTEVPCHKLSNQYMTFDCGSINVSEYYGNALDYGVYTKISIYLPYIGVREMKTDEIMGGTIHVKYNIDLLTGTCVACIKCTRQNLESVLYTFEGNLSAQLPLSSRDFSSMYMAMAKATIDTAVSGGVGTAVSAVGSAMNIMSSKPNMTRSGSISGNGGHLGLHTPYLIIERPIQSLPANAAQYYGYPSNITAQLGNLSGYTEIEHLIETDIHCTLDEWEEINDLLKSGVYL